MTRFRLTEQMKEAFEGLKQSLAFDSLTGLPSMAHFFELVDEAKDLLVSDGEQPVMLYFNLCDMKFYNRTHGFAEGDNLLRSFSQVVANKFGYENCCHIGGDHFAVFAIEDGLEDALRELFQDWRDVNEGNPLPVRVGIYSVLMGNVPASIACDRAKAACDSIRNRYASSFCYYNRKLQDDMEKRQYILSNIDRAIEQEWIQVYYQPIVRAVNGRVCDEEALARWIDPERGFMSPADFIPFLEEAGEIYKVDLYVLESALAKIHTQENVGLHLVPQSINLSRSDFDECDMVEEIRKRVDDAGVSRQLITIEITESTIGGNFEFMQTQIDRFQELGFKVWMDDFGSGYSSLDVLQSVKFNLIKFDMSFMKRLDEGEAGKIILTDLMKMATSLGVDTICEGVETEEQVRFLQAIGCSKLQGYYYLKPIPMEEILKRYEQGIQIGFENPQESAYYDGMGRINLYDLSFLANKNETVFRNTFDTLPMGVLEVNAEGTSMQYVRSNESFREFISRTLGFDASDQTTEHPVPKEGPGSVFMRKVGQCRTNGDRVFIEEKHADGVTIHSFARRVAVNPVTGKVAIAVAILTVTEPSDGATYASIARALAANYYNLFYVDLTTEDYIEYSSPVGGVELAVEHHGKDFFTTARQDTLSRVYEPDQEPFLSRFTKESILRELDERGVFTITYRLVDTGTPEYVRLKAMPMKPDINHIIIGISPVDESFR